MGWTTVEYSGRSFEGHDDALALWLALLVDEIDKLPEVPAWLRDARDQWELHATQRFGYGVIPALDAYATTDERRGAILGLCGPALSRLRSFGDPIPVAVLNSTPPTPPDEQYDGDMPAKLFVETAEDFVKLLDGRPLPQFRHSLPKSTVAAGGDT